MELALISTTPGSGYDTPHDPPNLLRRPSNPPDAEDWSTHKDIILKMYDEDDRPLSEVRLFMESCYGFLASERMYKRRFDKWDVKKNYTQEDVDILFDDLINDRVDIDHATIHGKPVNWERVIRHLDDSKLSLLPELKTSTRPAAKKPRRRSSTVTSTGSVTSYDSIDTRQSELSLSPVLEPCSRNRDGGQILQALERYLDAHLFSSPTRSIFGPAGFCNQTSTSQIFLHPAQLNQNYARGMILLRNGHRTAGFALLAQAANALDHLFSSHHPALASCFLDAFLDANHDTQPDARRFVIDHAVKAARTALSPNHPLAALCDFVQMTVQSKEEMEHLLWFCQKFCQMFSDRLTKQNKIAAYVNLKYFAKLMQVQRFASAYEHLTNHVEPAFVGFLTSEDVPNEMRPAALCYLRRKAHLLLSIGDLENAKASLTLAIRLTTMWLDDADSSVPGDPLLEETFRLIDEMGDYLRLTGNPERALHVHSFALELCTAVRGEREGKTMRMVSALVQHYEALGHGDQVLALQLRYPEVFETEDILDAVSHVLPCSNCGNGQDTQNFCEDHRVISEARTIDRSRLRAVKEYLRRAF